MVLAVFVFPWIFSMPVIADLKVLIEVTPFTDYNIGEEKKSLPTVIPPISLESMQQYLQKQSKQKLKISFIPFAPTQRHNAKGKDIVIKIPSAHLFNKGLLIDLGIILQLASVNQGVHIASQHSNEQEQLCIQYNKTRLLPVQFLLVSHDKNGNCTMQLLSKNKERVGIKNQVGFYRIFLYFANGLAKTIPYRLQEFLAQVKLTHISDE